MDIGRGAHEPWSNMSTPHRASRREEKAEAIVELSARRAGVKPCLDATIDRQPVAGIAKLARGVRDRRNRR
jgi:hypothetical protein